MEGGERREGGVSDTLVLESAAGDLHCLKKSFPTNVEQ